MNSIPAAMTWEMLRRGRWHLLFALLGGIAFPALILIALRHDGALNLSDPSMLLINLQLMLVSGMFFGAALFGSQSGISHLYAYPVRTTALVAWRVIPGMALMALEMVLCISFLNLLFNLEWPLWGPAMAMALMLAVVQASTWLTEKSLGWSIVALSVVALVFGLWFRARFGPLFANPTQTWTHVTPAEVFVMAFSAGIAYCVAVFAVGRNRRGEPPLSVGFWRWIASLFGQRRDVERPLSSPIEAQLWIEWTLKGWVMPVAAVFVIVVGLLGWFFTDRTAEDLFTGLFTGGYTTPFFGLLGGLLLGNVGPNDRNYIMGHFMATRPISNADMGRVLLRTAAKSVLVAWTIWAACFALACVCLWATGARGAMKLPPEFHWAYFPATLLGPWALTGGLMALCLMGRMRYVVQVVCLVPTAIIVFTLIGQMFLSHEVEALVGSVLTSLAAAALIVAAGLSFVAARRRQLVESGTIWAAAAVWTAAMAIGFFEMPKAAHPIWLAYFLLAAFMAWVVAPFAAVPLALSWNRHR